jgi:hypothetical protein
LDREALGREERLNKMRQARSVAMVLSLVCAPGAAPAATPFNRQSWLKDYAYLKTALEERYANLAWFGSAQSGVNLPVLDRRTLRALNAADNDEAAKAALLAFVSSFHDGHFSSVGVLQPKKGDMPAPAEPDYSKMSATEGCAALGFAPVRSVAFSLSFESLPGTTLESDGLSRIFRAGVVTASDGTRFGIVRIARFRQQDASPAGCVQAWQAQQAAGGAIDVKAVSEAANDIWYTTLAAQLKHFREQGVAAVIVDVGGNSGGNDSGDWAVRMFTSGEVHSARLLMSAAPLANLYFDEQLGDLQAAQKEEGASPEARQALQDAVAAFEARKAGLATRGCKLSWVWSEQRAWQPFGCSRLIDAGYASGHASYLPAHAFGNEKIAASIYWAAQVDSMRGAWSGPVYVLTDGQTASSAEMFAALMHDSGIARTVGRPTAGDGCGFMANVPPVELPSSHMRFRVPNCVRLRADGSNEVAGVQPDLPVLPTEGESDRNRAYRLLETIAADLRGRSPKP